LDSDIFRVYQQKQQAGTTQQFVSLGFLRKIPVPIPMVNDEINYSLIDGINKKIEIADNELLTKHTKIQTLQRLKKSLMQNLLTGKVRLPQEFIAQFENSIEEMNKIEQ
jgi:type I restriction enzyme S subunit